ncbi:MAG: NAD(P)/FAD-dependent oxidoreductase, partial [Clostridiales bacterium]|nr:NAD(P)/FAD-dependent oxidoreductase [Clostridiales bacterium]
MYDVIIVGAGVIGCAVAQEVAKYEGKLLVIDRADDVSEGASKANSGLVHAGHDAQPGSEKARLNVKGAKMFKELCRKLGVPYGQPGAMVLAFSEEDREVLEKLLAQSIVNEVEDCRIINHDEILRMEPNVNPDVVCALYVPTSGLVSPYELTNALANAAAFNGAEFKFDTEVTSLEPVEEGWAVHTQQGVFHARAVVNCAGVFGGKLHNMISSRKVSITSRRGQYYLIDRESNLRFGMTMFQVPTSMGKGVLITPTTHGNLIVGPNAEDIEDRLDTSTTAQGLEEILSTAKLTYPGLTVRNVITTFSGIRAHEKDGDFIIGAVEGAKEGAFEAIGIESPGLSAAPAIGEELGMWVAYSLKLQKKQPLNEMPPMPKSFSHMSEKEKIEAYHQNSDYGQIICRCEMVTEAEVRQSIRQSVGAKNIDGVKRRTRAGMGRCQGG